MASGDTKTNQYLDIAANGTRADVQHGCCETRTQSLIMDVADRIITEEETRAREDQILQGEIDEIKNNPDVADIVPTYAALQDYDTSTLTDKDIIRVLADETHGGASTYYRWNTSSETFTYVGEAGDYYTKNQVDTLLDGKQDELTAGENITIEDESGSLVISAAGGNYTAGDGINISAQDVISATNTGKARVLTTADYNYPTSNPTSVAMWLLDPGLYYVPSGVSARPYANSSTSGFLLVGFDNTKAFCYTWRVDWDSVTMYHCQTSDGSGATGGELKPAQDNLTSTSTANPLSANQGKVLKDLIDSIAIRGAGAPTTSTVGEVGQLYEDGTNGELYQLKSIDITTTPNTYNWEQVGGSSVNVVQTPGTSTTDVMSQNAVTSMVFADPGTGSQVQIGSGSHGTAGSSSTAVGKATTASADFAIALGNASTASASRSLAVGNAATAAYDNSVAIGTNAATTVAGEVNIGAGTSGRGYNNSNYRLLTGLYDPQSAHDAATKGYVDPTTDSSAPTTATVGRLGQIFIDTTNADAYMCVAVDSVTPSYTWKKITA